ncbi:hypothetical protein [Lutimonas vermicola]|uniref:Lipocalin-like domain-containing protein n=1 Tax=Lutimonas vermicola TaxID=414288 RepID=A0ABU9KZW7_9FLAO
MNTLKHFVSRFFILFALLGLLISHNSCVPDQKDKGLFWSQGFLEKYDGTTWKLIEEEMRIYVRLNDDIDKDLELWMSDLELAKLMTRKECFYHSHETLNTEEVEVLEISENKLVFTYLDDETYTFSMDGERLKVEFETLDNVKKTVYFSKTTEDVDDLDICPEEKSKDAFDWKFLK